MLCSFHIIGAIDGAKAVVDDLLKVPISNYGQKLVGKELKATGIVQTKLLGTVKYSGFERQTS